MFTERNQYLRRPARDAAEMISLGAGEGYRRCEGTYAWLVTLPLVFFSAGLTAKVDKTRLMKMVMQVGLVITQHVRFC